LVLNAYLFIVQKFTFAHISLKKKKKKKIHGEVPRGSGMLSQLVFV